MEKDEKQGTLSSAPKSISKLTNRLPKISLEENFQEDVAVKSSPVETPNNEIAAPAKPEKKPFWKNYKVLLGAWAAMLIIVALGLYFNVDRFLIGDAVVLVGLVSSAFTGLIALLGAVPIAGPLIVKVLSIPFIWLINALGYLVSLIAIRRGYTKDVLTYRGLTIALIIGITIGYILGKLI
jgi:hypothetical protein